MNEKLNKANKILVEYVDSDPYSTPREAFASLIDKVSGKGIWERNPWVFAYAMKKS